MGKHSILNLLIMRKRSDNDGAKLFFNCPIRSGLAANNEVELDKT